jgi:hypothetical protein
MDQWAVFADGVDVDLLNGVNDDTRHRAAMQAINKIARDARSEAAREIRQQINLPLSYVSPAQGRLAVTQQANMGSLQARITASGKATSLARFVVGNPAVGKAGVWIEVQPGKARFMKRGFLIKLPQGRQFDVDTKFNMGLAIRLRKGEKLSNKISARRVSSGLYVLYGPSVYQVFRANDGSGVATDMAPDVALKLRDEFLRLIDL